MPKRAKAEHGQVVVQVAKGNLNLQIPSVYAQLYYERRQQYISFGAKDTPQNRLLAMTAALEMQKDLESDRFDPAHVLKYKHPSKRLTAAGVKAEFDYTPLWLFEEFVGQLKIAKTTRLSKYRQIRNHLKRMANIGLSDLREQLKLKNWIVDNVAPTKALELLALLYRMIDWGKREERLPADFTNKFKDYEKEFKKSLKTVNIKRKAPKSVQGLINDWEGGIKAWSEEERDIIIQAFYDRPFRNEWNALAHLIDFLFNVGCRHGEAFALTWGDISSDFTKLRITKSCNAFNILKGTKTGKERTVPLNKRTQELLKRIKPEDAQPGDLVFVQWNGKAFTTSSVSGYWNPSSKPSIIKRLIDEGKLTRYADMYSTRRTFISLQIAGGMSPVDVANWVGDNPETIFKHYARHNEKAVPL